MHRDDGDGDEVYEVTVGKVRARGLLARSRSRCRSRQERERERDVHFLPHFLQDLSRKTEEGDERNSHQLCSPAARLRLFIKGSTSEESEREREADPLMNAQSSL